MLRWFRRRKPEEETPAPAEFEVGGEAAPAALDESERSDRADIARQLNGVDTPQPPEDQGEDGFIEEKPQAPEVGALHMESPVESIRELFPAADEGATGLEEDVEIEAGEATEPKKKSLFARLRERLSATKESLVGSLRTAIRLRGKVDEELIEELEEILIQSDVGVETTVKITAKIRAAAMRKGELKGDAILALVKEAVEEILSADARELDLTVGTPTIVLVVGVNGTGKTTTIGKIAKAESNKGRKVMLVAADTFRAGAADQLQIWAERTGSCIVRQDEGADPASVVYEALEGARKEPPDLILIDTAGRLHNKKHLMEELMKINRVIKKHHEAAPHETLLVIDGTTGQNAINQVRVFNEAVKLSGLIMTKLDGTAKGGILIAVKDQFPLPIMRIGIGEGAEDLREFNAHQYVEALFAE